MNSCWSVKMPDFTYNNYTPYYPLLQVLFASPYVLSGCLRSAFVYGYCTKDVYMESELGLVLLFSVPDVNFYFLWTHTIWRLWEMMCQHNYLPYDVSCEWVSGHPMLTLLGRFAGDELVWPPQIWWTPAVNYVFCVSSKCNEFWSYWCLQLHSIAWQLFCIPPYPYYLKSNTEAYSVFRSSALKVVVEFLSVGVSGRV